MRMSEQYILFLNFWSLITYLDPLLRFTFFDTLSGVSARGGAWQSSREAVCMRIGRHNCAGWVLRVGAADEARQAQGHHILCGHGADAHAFDVRKPALLARADNPAVDVPKAAPLTLAVFKSLGLSVHELPL